MAKIASRKNREVRIEDGKTKAGFAQTTKVRICPASILQIKLNIVVKGKYSAQDVVFRHSFCGICGIMRSGAGGKAHNGHGGIVAVFVVAALQDPGRYFPQRL
jgi:hypothetical protein